MLAPEDEVAAEPAASGPVVQEVDMTLDNLTDRALFRLLLGTLPSGLRSEILYHGPCRSKGPLAISSENGNRHTFSDNTTNHNLWYAYRPAMALLLANDEEAILSKLLVVRDPSAKQKEWDNRCVGQPDRTSE